MSHYKPYPAYKDSGVEWLGRVPEHWDVSRLRNCVEGSLSYGANEAAESDDPLNPRFIRITDLNEDGTLREDTFKSLPPDIAHPYLLKDGDVLLARSGATVGKSFIYRRDMGAACYAGYLIRARLFVSRVLPRLFWYYTQSSYYWSFIAGSNIQATIQNVSGEKYSNLWLVVPPITEQESIVFSLDHETARIDALIEKKTRFIELLREKRQALITYAVTKGLDPNVKMKDSGVEWLGEVPEHWDVLQLRHTARLESGHTPSRSKPEYWVDCTVPWFTLADVWQVRSGEQKYVSETAEKVSQLGLENSSARLLPAGSVFLSRTASVGFPGIMAVDMATSQDFAVWTCTSELFNEYLYYVLLGMKPDFDRLMMGSTHKTIYMPDIEAIRIARPPVDEQRGIVSALSGQLGRFKTVIDKTERSIELLKERRSALITAAVTGQIDLREAV
ncbi:restriction endonuclease subunit S [Pseudomonas aeruginosa]|uniref:restriction endonuclease subunit S n=1 Tax=Pseudomonas aeruginosa TaxID=287 RepID=UPI000F51D3E9|nr:restriction endonuclease subunit S [Pseudomonas aeruginosa]EIU5492560.1 restriction endonuclease subunit S [Pseudomonas aeruginosa]MBI7142365.1 restriction endonuclease subunit S [Pseudomonas aeruginosa]MDP5588923.1 restriction endonuclease subunit S [Pseudomonas aeruginosa]MDV6939634.1 restriction endonuclease subunit S [Pseudomonas aeruginosa]RPN07094.1 type I restriction endonuclease subunit S [Pseudomonas aeruginosa]